MSVNVVGLSCECYVLAQLIVAEGVFTRILIYSSQIQIIVSIPSAGQHVRHPASGFALSTHIYGFYITPIQRFMSHVLKSPAILIDIQFF